MKQNWKIPRRSVNGIRQIEKINKWFLKIINKAAIEQKMYKMTTACLLACLPPVLHLGSAWTEFLFLFFSFPKLIREWKTALILTKWPTSCLQNHYSLIDKMTLALFTKWWEPYWQNDPIHNMALVLLSKWP